MGVPLPRGIPRHQTRRYSSSRGLRRINDPATDLVLWRREIPDAVHRWLEALPARRLPQGRVLVTPATIAAALAELFADSGTPAGEGARLLALDVVDLALRFAAIVGCETLDVNLEAIIDRNGCWKFHRDHVPVRLLTTYRGPGTQLVSARYARRALHEQQMYHGPLTELAAGTVAMFKGSSTGIVGGGVHRSPPIAGAGIARLVLKVNLPSAASPPPWAPHR
jgi:Protein of unknown function (DUF1826)